MPLSIQNHFNLKAFHTFRIDVFANYFTSVKSLLELQEALDWCDKKQIPFLVIGQGSNVLFIENYAGLVIQNQLEGIAIVDENENTIQVEVSAGMLWDDWVQYAISHHWQGLENLSLIPGTVGAAPIQNIGAYGVEVEQHIIGVHYFDVEKKSMQQIAHHDCAFAYRTSRFKTDLKHKAIITSVVFELRKKNYNYCLTYKELATHFSTVPLVELAAIRRLIVYTRQQKLPDYKVQGNAGSFFKNPIVDKSLFEKNQQTYPDIPSYPESLSTIKIPAAWLIERCGWKGKQIGNVSTHRQHALVIMNCGNASGQEILDYAKGIQQSVFDTFGISLETEVNMIVA